MGHRIQPALSRLRRGMGGVFFVGVPAGGGPGVTYPEAPKGPVKRSAVRAPATLTNSGRRMSYEEGVAQQMLQMNQTVARTNHLADIIPSPSETERNGKGESDGKASRLPFTYMGVQGQAPASILLPAIGATATVVSFTCPPRHNGEIEFIANQFVGGGWTEGSGALIWQVLIDSVPVQGYDAIFGSLGTTASPGWLGSGEIRFSEGQLVQLQCRNVSVLVAGQVLLALLRGNFVPVDSWIPEGW